MRICAKAVAPVSDSAARGAAPAPRVPAAPVAPTDPRWRERAEAAFDAGEPIADALDVTPGAGWIGLLLLALLVVGALLFAVFGRIEVTARGPAALRTAQGTLSVVAEATGPVGAVKVRSGERVAAGQALIAIDATALQATLDESERRLDFAETRAAQTNTRLDELASDRRRLLEQRARLLEQRIAIQTQSIDRYQQRAKDFDQLRSQGFVSEHARGDAVDRLDDAQRQRLALAEELARVRSDISEITAQRESEKLRLDEDRAAARARRDAAQAVLRQGVAVAPQSGVVESVVVRVGETVQPGALVARIVPDGAPDQIVAFISERDRAFLAAGARVRVDVKQLPAGEFGALEGRVVRIGADLATAGEIRDALGEGTPPAATGHYRVDIALNSDAQAAQLRPYLRAGMQADVRFTLRERRIITLILEPLRKWLQ